MADGIMVAFIVEISSFKADSLLGSYILMELAPSAKT